MVFRRSYGLLAVALLLLSCGKDLLPDGDGTPKEVLIPMDTKAVVPAYDGDNFTTFRMLLMEQDRPWLGVLAQGTYCNIYKHSGSETGQKWYHPIRCNAQGAALTDSGTAITSWTQSAGEYLANGTVPEYKYNWSSGDTWGNSSSALWARDTLHLRDEVQNYMPYRFMAVSPAREMTSSQDGGRAGLRMSRKESLLVSDAVKVSLRGTSLSNAGLENQLYVYGLNGTTPDLTMREPRSKLTVKVYVDEGLGEIRLSKIVLGNYITEGIYLPVGEVTGTPNWVYDWDGNSHLFANSSYATADEFGDDSNYDLKSVVQLKYRGPDGSVNPPITAIHDFYILSQDYSEMDPNNASLPVHPVPTVKLLFPGTGGEGDVPVSIPLTWNFEPQHHYTFTVRIATRHLFLYVQGSAWDTDSWTSINYTFGNDIIQTIYLEHPLSNENTWENGGGGTGTI